MTMCARWRWRGWRCRRSTNDPGGLGAVRAEARAGGADVRRQRSRSRLAGRRRVARAAGGRRSRTCGATSPRPASRRSRPRRDRAPRSPGPRPLRLGAVSYLNTKPLVYGLDAGPDLFDVRFDVPAKCAALLHEGRVDLGLIPAIEYLRGDYAIVPDIAIGSDGRRRVGRGVHARADRARSRRSRSTSARARRWR